MRWMGPFVIDMVMKNKQAVKLTLRKGDKFHPIVPVHRIKRYYEDKSPKRAHIEPPPTVLIEDVHSYEVERILNRGGILKSDD